MKEAVHFNGNWWQTSSNKRWCQQAFFLFIISVEYSQKHNWKLQLVGWLECDWSGRQIWGAILWICSHLFLPLFGFILHSTLIMLLSVLNIALELCVPSFQLREGFLQWRWNCWEEHKRQRHSLILKGKAGWGQGITVLDGHYTAQKRGRGFVSDLWL